MQPKIVDREALQREAARYRWYHCIEIAPGIVTPGIPWAKIFVDEFRAANLAFAGRRVLDIGCRDGAMLLIAEQGGAAELVGADNDPSRGFTEFLAPLFGSKIRIVGANLYDIDTKGLGLFDMVICAGVIYHLRYPIYGLKKLASMTKPGGEVVIETGVAEAFGDFPMLFYPQGPESPYESSSVSFFNWAGLISACAAVGLDSPNILRRFGSLTYRPAAHFPNSEIKDFEVTRVISTWRRRGEDVRELDGYFEGFHRFHSTGKF